MTIFFVKFSFYQTERKVPVVVFCYYAPLLPLLLQFKKKKEAPNPVL